jgi:hypothetical protein
MKRKGTTAVPTDALPVCANDPERPVMMTYEINITALDVRKRNRRPRRSTSRAAPTAKMRFQICMPVKLLESANKEGS